MKLKTPNENPSLFYDILALVEKVAHPKYVLDAIGGSSPKISFPEIQIQELAAVAQAILEHWKKLEKK